MILPVRLELSVMVNATATTTAGTVAGKLWEPPVARPARAITVSRAERLPGYPAESRHVSRRVKFPARLGPFRARFGTVMVELLDRACTD